MTPAQTGIARVMAACLGLAVTSASAQTPLSLAEALARAADHHPAATTARWDRRASEADALGAAAAFLPRLSAELGGVRSDDPVAVFGTKLRQGRFTQADFTLEALNFPSPVTDVRTTLSLEQPLVQPEAWFGRRAARAGAEASRLVEERTGQVVAFDVIRGYFGARLAADRVPVLEESLEAARRTLAQVERLRAEGVVTVVDAQLARSRVSELEASLAAAGASKLAAADLLLESLGMPPGEPVELSDSLVLPEETTPDSSTRPDLAALRAALAAQEAGVRRAQSQWIPSLAAFGSLSWHNRDFGLASGPSHWTAGLLLRWTPLRGLSDVGALRRARADREAARSHLDAMERHAQTERRAAAAQRDAAQASYRAAEAALVQASQAARAANSRYTEGVATITELLAVRAAESSQRLARLQALYEARVAGAALVLARGGTPR